MSAGPYLYSYSGADSRAYAYFGDRPQQITQLESMHTVSLSIFEAKGDVRSLGYRGVRGFTRSIRTIAGSMIFQVIRDHPLRGLMGQWNPDYQLDRRLGWSMDRDYIGVGTPFSNLDFHNRFPTILPPFNLMITYVSELGGSNPGSPFSPINRNDNEHAAMLIKGIEFVTDGIVTSVNDIVSEMTFSFKARDAKPISSNKFTVSGR